MCRVCGESGCGGCYGYPGPAAPRCPMCDRFHCEHTLFAERHGLNIEEFNPFVVAMSVPATFNKKVEGGVEVWEGDTVWLENEACYQHGGLAGSTRAKGKIVECDEDGERVLVYWNEDHGSNLDGREMWHEPHELELDPNEPRGEEPVRGGPHIRMGPPTPAERIRDMNEAYRMLHGESGPYGRGNVF